MYPFSKKYMHWGYISLVSRALHKPHRFMLMGLLKEWVVQSHRIGISSLFKEMREEPLCSEDDHQVRRWEVGIC